MANWTGNNRACTTLWSTLFRMRQLVTNFDESGSLKMSDLLFFNNLSSGDLRRQEAIIIADQLDNIFRLGRGAVYEASMDRAKAMQAMVNVLTDEKKTVAELAEASDKAYHFWQE